MEKYIETEFKVLNVSIQDLVSNLEQLGATKVFEGERTITHYDFPTRVLSNEQKDLRITEEGTIKFSIDVRNSQNGNKSIKVKASREAELADILKEIGIQPIAVCKTKRISYELNGIDFDIDDFYDVPAFLEVDGGETPAAEIEQLLAKLGIIDNQRTTKSSKEIFGIYGVDYWKAKAV